MAIAARTAMIATVIIIQSGETGWRCMELPSFAAQ